MNMVWSHFFLRKFYFSIAYLAVYMESGAILPLRPLYTDPNRRHLGDLNAAVNAYYRSYCDLTPDILACLRVGFPPLSGETAVRVLQSGLRIGAQQAID